MKLPLWYKTKDGKWIILTHFPDGQIGLTMQQAVEAGLSEGPGSGMGKLNSGRWYHTWDTSIYSRFLLYKEPE